MDAREQQQELLSAYLDGELTPPERAEVEALLRDDAQAREDLALLRSVSESVQQLPARKAPPAVMAGLRGQLAQLKEREAGGNVIRAGEAFRPQQTAARPQSWAKSAMSVAAILMLGVVVFIASAPLWPETEFTMTSEEDDGLTQQPASSDPPHAADRAKVAATGDDTAVATDAFRESGKADALQEKDAGQVGARHLELKKAEADSLDGGRDKNDELHGAGAALAQKNEGDAAKERRALPKRAPSRPVAPASADKGSRGMRPSENASSQVVKRKQGGAAVGGAPAPMGRDGATAAPEPKAAALKESAKRLEAKDEKSVATARGGVQGFAGREQADAAQPRAPARKPEARVERLRANQAVPAPGAAPLADGAQPSADREGGAPARDAAKSGMRQEDKPVAAASELRRRTVVRQQADQDAQGHAAKSLGEAKSENLIKADVGEKAADADKSVARKKARHVDSNNRAAKDDAGGAAEAKKQAAAGMATLDQVQKQQDVKAGEAAARGEMMQGGKSIAPVTSVRIEGNRAQVKATDLAEGRAWLTDLARRHGGMVSAAAESEQTKGFNQGAAPTDSSAQASLHIKVPANQRDRFLGALAQAAQSNAGKDFASTDKRAQDTEAGPLVSQKKVEQQRGAKAPDQEAGELSASAPAAAAPEMAEMQAEEEKIPNNSKAPATPAASEEWVQIEIQLVAPARGE